MSEQRYTVLGKGQKWIPGPGMLGRDTWWWSESIGHSGMNPGAWGTIVLPSGIAGLTDFGHIYGICLLVHLICSYNNRLHIIAMFFFGSTKACYFFWYLLPCSNAYKIMLSEPFWIILDVLETSWSIFFDFSTFVLCWRGSLRQPTWSSPPKS